MAISAAGIGKAGKKAFKWIAILLAMLILLVVGVVVLLQTQWGQAQLTKGVVFYAKKKLQTEVSIGQIRIHQFRQLHIYDLLLKDKANKILINLDSLEIDLGLDEILSKKIQIKEIYLSGLTTGIYRYGHDSVFNFQFIADAFSSTGTDTSTSENTWGVDVKKIELQRIQFHWEDGLQKDTFLVGLKQLDLAFNAFDVNTLAFGTEKLMLDGLETKINIGPSLPPEKNTARYFFTFIFH
jgi:translocation and assembly module TamB